MNTRHTHLDHTASAHRGRKENFRGGFTLVELLVTISIIALLMAISIPAGLKMYTAADAGRVRAMLNGLAAAADEYNITTDQRVELDNPGALGQKFRTVTGQTVVIKSKNDADNNTIAIFIAQASQVPSVVNMLTSSSKKLLLRDTGTGFEAFDLANLDFNGDGDIDQADVNEIRILDVWDTPIRYAPFNRPGPDDLNDDDYLPARPNPFFVSAGPDGEFGDVRTSATDELQEQAKDNIYSFDNE